MKDGCKVDVYCDFNEDEHKECGFAGLDHNEWRWDERERSWRGTLRSRSESDRDEHEERVHLINTIFFTSTNFFVGLSEEVASMRQR